MATAKKSAVSLVSDIQQNYELTSDDLVSVALHAKGSKLRESKRFLERENDSLEKQRKESHKSMVELATKAITTKYEAKASKLVKAFTAFDSGFRTTHEVIYNSIDFKEGYISGSVRFKAMLGDTEFLCSQTMSDSISIGVKIPEAVLKLNKNISDLANQLESNCDLLFDIESEINDMAWSGIVAKDNLVKLKLGETDNGRELYSQIVGNALDSSAALKSLPSGK